MRGRSGRVAGRPGGDVGALQEHRSCARLVGTSEPLLWIEVIRLRAGREHEPEQGGRKDEAEQAGHRTQPSGS
jgi:hypothetical protein